MMARGLLLLCGMFSGIGHAQTSSAPLPANYKTILENDDVLVMRVHYGPHEFVPMHDHSAYPTVYVYLNNAGPIQIKHDGPEEEVVTRPPTHVGAFRIAPGLAERHSVQSQSDTASDFLRVELKHLPAGAIPAEFRGKAPTELTPGLTVLYDKPSLRVERLICSPDTTCKLAAESAPSVLIALPTTSQTSAANNVTWIPANANLNIEVSPGDPAHVLRIVLLAH